MQSQEFKNVFALNDERFSLGDKLQKGGGRIVRSKCAGEHRVTWTSENLASVEFWHFGVAPFQAMHHFNGEMYEKQDAKA